MCFAQQSKGDGEIKLCKSRVMLIYLIISALLVLATYKELLPRIGLRRLVLLNLCCSGFGVFYSITVCMQPSLYPVAGDDSR